MARPAQDSAPTAPRPAGSTERGALVTRPLSAPPELAGGPGRRYELFGPVLFACLQEAVEVATANLFEDADSTHAEDRRRLSFEAARGLAALRPTLRHRMEDALLRLFTDPKGLEDGWRGEVGTFTLEQLAERLQRSRGPVLDALARRLHGRSAEDATQRSTAMAQQLAGLLAAVIDSDQLPAHARNVVCAHYGRRLDGILPALAGARASATAEPTPATRLLPDAPLALRTLPAPITDALTRAQLAALDGALTSAPADDLARRCSRSIGESRARFDPEEAERVVAEIRRELDTLAPILDAPDLPRPVREALRRLQPIIVRSHLQHGGPNPRTIALVETLVGELADLGGDSDPRHGLLEDVCGDLLARYVGDEAGLAEMIGEARDRLAGARRRLAEIRRRARDRALTERRREAARQASDRVCRRLAARPELASFLLDAWGPALTQAHLRYGPASAPWRRMLVLGQGLLTADAAALAAMRPALADALSLALADAPEAERILEGLAGSIGTGLDPTILPAGIPEPPPEHDLRPLAEHHAWRLADSRRRWVLVQPEDGDGQVLLADALARHLDWIPASELHAQIEAGEARALSVARIAGAWSGTVTTRLSDPGAAAGR